jgi:hypothetical protein
VDRKRSDLKIEEVEMENIKTVATLTVYNKPFFVNELLRNIQPDSIKPKLFAEMVKESRTFDINTMLTAMTRQIDCSGVVPNLAGVYDDPEDVLEMLMNLGHVQLMKIAQLDHELQNEVFETLKGGPDTTLRGLLVLDECQAEIIGQLMQVRQRSALALAMRRATEEALKDLYKKKRNLCSSTFDSVISYDDRRMLYNGEPCICYLKHVYRGHVVEVWQYFFMPKLDDIRLPAPFERYCAGKLLTHITPKDFRRGYVDDAKFDPRTPSGFIGLLGKVGGALPRLIARHVKKNELLRQQVMREEEIAAALRELFSR